MSCTSSQYVRHPGKFEGSGEIGEKLHSLMVDGSIDEEVGDVDGFGWYGLIINTGLDCAPDVIVSESSQGFFEYTIYSSPREARDAWAHLGVEYDAYCSFQL